MAIKWVDRVATHPGRVQLTPVQGQTNIYDMERADEPTVAGTPINAANLNAMQKNMGLDANKTVYVAVSGSDATGNGSSTAPYQTITKALSTIPKNLNGYDAMVYVSSGTYNENVTIDNFNGGRLTLSGESGTLLQINTLTIMNCYVQINDTLVVSVANLICSRGSRLLSNAEIKVRSGATYGVLASNISTAFFHKVVVDGSTYAAICLDQNSRIFITHLDGSGNTNIGLLVAGGTLKYDNSTLSATIATSAFSGGRIYSGAQTSIPNY